MSNSEISFVNGILRGPLVPSEEGQYKVGEILLQAMKKNADNVAQIDPETELEETYGNMADRSIRCALWLRKRGVKAGDVISICTKKNTNYLIPLLSSLFTGAIANAWREDFDEDYLLKCLKIVNPKFFFVDKQIGMFIKKLFDKTNIKMTLICLQKSEDMMSLDEILSEIDVEEVRSFQCSPVEAPTQPAAIVWTSGSSGGPPKGALLSYRSLGEAVTLAAPVCNGNTCICLTDVFWITDLFFCLNAIKGGTTIIQGPLLADADTFDIIQRYKVEWLRISVFHIAHLFKYDPHLIHCDVSSVKYLIFGGAAVSDNILKKLSEWFSSAQLIYEYGITEVSGRLAETICSNRKPDSSGKLLKNVELKVVDYDGTRITNPYRKGELLFRRPTAMIGYYNNPEETAKVFDDEGFYRSGDYGYYDADGNIFITDRLKDMIRSTAGVLSSTAIEQVIMEHPGVLDVAVVVKMSELGFEMPFAFVVKNPNIHLTEKEIMDFVDERKSKSIDLEGALFVESLPKTSNGKIKKAELRGLARSHAAIN